MNVLEHDDIDARLVGIRALKGSAVEIGDDLHPRGPFGADGRQQLVAIFLEPGKAPFPGRSPARGDDFIARDQLEKRAFDPRAIRAEGAIHFHLEDEHLAVRNFCQPVARFLRRRLDGAIDERLPRCGCLVGAAILILIPLIPSREKGMDMTNPIGQIGRCLWIEAANVNPRGQKDIFHACGGGTVGPCVEHTRPRDRGLIGLNLRVIESELLVISRAVRDRNRPLQDRQVRGRIG